MKKHKSIRAALQGRPSSAVIYWDRQDPSNVGPAYRFEGESGVLEFIEWSNGESSMVGYELPNYFGRDGSYKGPDCDGIYPILS